MIEVIQVGLGPIGVECARLVFSRPELKLVGCADTDPELAGRDLGELLRRSDSARIRVQPDLSDLAAGKRDSVAIQTTGSYLKEVAPQIFSLLDAGFNVVSSAEELLLPFFTDPVLAREIDRKAREKGVTVLGTGINPGFLLDYLPLVLCGVCQEVKKIRAIRVVDSATRRHSFQTKMGAGIALVEFEKRRTIGAIGHVGLKESVAFLAEGLGWELDRIDDNLKPIIAERDMRTEFFKVSRGSVAGIHQVARGIMGGEEKIVLDLQMFAGAPAPRDTILIEGRPSLKVVVEGGIPGDEASVAALVNSIAPVVAAPPGLKTMKDLPPLRARKGFNQ